MYKTRKMAFVAILGALSFVLMLANFPLLPGAEFLKMDFSILPILVALAMLGLKSSLAVLMIRSLLKLLLDNGGIGGIIGLPMNIVAMSVFLLAFAYIWQRQRTWQRLVIAGIVGTLSMTGGMLLLNYIYAIPVYATFAQFDIRAIIGLKTYLLGMVIPFNVLEGFLFTLGFAVLVLPLRPNIDRCRRYL
ncbi:ECF transporter S component [Streptococcus fryi]